MLTQSNSSQTFGQVHFGHAQLGDKRRTKRLVKCADCMARHPGGTLPQKFRNPAELKAFYRLCDTETVTHKVILNSHREAVLKQITELDHDLLVIHDATELDYTNHFALDGLGQIGNGKRHRGYICQNSLLVDPAQREVLGLLNQTLHRRVKVRKGETSRQRRTRSSRESRLWLKGTSPLPKRRQFIDVCDQGADTFEFLAHETNSGRRFVIRSAYNRRIFVGHEDEQMCDLLRTHVMKQPSIGDHTVEVKRRRQVKSPKKKGRKKVTFRQAREAEVSVSAAAVQIRPPQEKTGEYANEPLRLWIVRVWEANPPADQEALEWFLLTNEPVESYADAGRVVKWYECRWVIEEYHKALKTGCGIENPQFTTQQRLQPVIALLSVVALTLLSLRDAGRRSDAKTRPVSEVVHSDYVEALSLWRHGKVRLDWSVYDFFFALARLGGHQNRKHDTDPGWLTLWRGWTALQFMANANNAAKQLHNCG